MCLGKCLKQNACPRVLSCSDYFQDGNRLTKITPSGGNGCSVFWGDAFWVKAGQHFIVFEHHNIERAILDWLNTHPGKTHLLDLLQACRMNLGNPQIYRDLVLQRLCSLRRHGFVKASSSSATAYDWELTIEGRSLARSGWSALRNNSFL